MGIAMRTVWIVTVTIPGPSQDIVLGHQETVASISMRVVAVSIATRSLTCEMAG